MDINYSLFLVQLFLIMLALRSLESRSLTQTYFWMLLILLITSLKFLLVWDSLHTITGSFPILNTITSHLRASVSLESLKRLVRLQDYSSFLLMVILLLMLLNFAMYCIYSSEIKPFLTWITVWSQLLGLLVMSIMLWAVVFMVLRLSWMLAHRILIIFLLEPTRGSHYLTAGISYLS